MNRVFGNIASFARFVILVAIFISIFRFVQWSSSLFDKTQTYTTQYLYEPQYRLPPDTVIKFIEHITQVEVPPLIIYDTIKYDSPPIKHMIRNLKADGKLIKIQTQYCNTTLGKEFIFPYTPYFQATPTDNNVKMIKYKNYFDFTGLNIEYRLKCGLNGSHEVLAKTGIQVVPLGLKTSCGASMSTIGGVSGNEIDFNIVFMVEKRIW